MKYWLNHLFWTVCRLLLSLRYRVRVDGLEQLDALSGATLVLPNHPAYIDPLLVASRVRLRQPLRPLVFSGTFRKPWLRPLMRLVDALEVPDLSEHSRDAQAQTRAVIDAVVARVAAGDNMLIYPSGRLQRGDREVVGAARSVYEIVARCPEVSIVLVRTRGVWGSRFSCAATGTLPDLTRQSWAAVGWALANCLFFMPRRRVHLQIERVPRASLPLESREAFNTFLEQWYNRDGGEQPSFVRYHRWLGPGHGNFGGVRQRLVEVNRIRPKTIQLVNELVQLHLGRHLSESELRAERTLESLGLDSLDRMDLALKIEEQFTFRSDQVVDSLGELWALADGQLASANESSRAAPAAWTRHLANNGTSRESKIFQPVVLAETIAAAFVRQALRAPEQVIVADDLSGALTYRRMLVGARLLAGRLARLGEANVGLMLPASVAADVAFMALQLAGKVPVMVNWTTGPAHLAHAAATTGLRHIVTSRKMIDRLGIQPIDGAEFVFLEDLRAEIGKLEALWELLTGRLLPRRLIRQLPNQQPGDTAVLLFTSGSESLPKTVPLSHRNLIVNIRDGLQVLEPPPGATLLGFLPPFHSFGLSGNVLLPCLTGIACVHHPNPTDAGGLVRTIAAYQPSLLFTTPTFLGYILAACSGDELHSLRRIVTGAEKCPSRLFQQCAHQAPRAVILEGYGITECSPVVAANRVDNSRPGTIGLALASVRTCIVDIDSGSPLSPGEVGMLLVAGESVFSGYYRYQGQSPFVELAGQRWYRTGDLVSQDADGFLTFHGRLKRFLKAGGEMISLPALEEPFVNRFPADENGPKMAVEGVETDDGRHIVLFTTEDITLRQASQWLIEAGLRGVMRLDEVRRVERIPVLGTGKTDYKELRKQIQPA